MNTTNILHHFYYGVRTWVLLGINKHLNCLWALSEQILGTVQKKSNYMIPLLDLTACFLWCLDKFSHCLQQTHCNSPPWVFFEITFIAAISSDSAPFFCCKRMGHTNLNPVPHSLQGKKRRQQAPWQLVVLPLPLLPCRSRRLAVLFAPICSSKNLWVSPPWASGWDSLQEPEFLKWFRKAKEKDYGFTYIINAYAFIPSNHLQRVLCTWGLPVILPDFSLMNAEVSVNKNVSSSRVLCLRNKRCIESNLPWVWGEIGDWEMLL